MKAWTSFDGDDAQWDQLVESLGGRSPFATAGWAMSKSTGRWDVTRAVATVDGKVVAAAQVFWSTLLNQVTIGWIPGGVSYTHDPLTSELASWFAGVSRSRATYIRAAFHRADHDADEQRLRSSGWSPCPRFIGAHETFVVEAEATRLANPARLTSNWRRNLERGIKRGQIATVWSVPDATEIGELMKEMAEYKQSKGPGAVSTAEALEHLVSGMGERLVVVQVRDPQGSLQAVRGAFIVGDHAWDALAAAGVDARKSYSSYVCAWRLLEELDEHGVKTFDLAGVDPLENEGVFNFKKGMGGRRTTYLGEWDWATSRLVRRIARIVISRMG